MPPVSGGIAGTFASPSSRSSPASEPGTLRDRMRARSIAIGPTYSTKYNEKATILWNDGFRRGPTILFRRRGEPSLTQINARRDLRHETRQARRAKRRPGLREPLAELLDLLGGGMADAIDGEIDDVGLADEARQQGEIVVDAAVMRDQRAAALGDESLELVDQFRPSADIENLRASKRFAEFVRASLVERLERRFERGELSLGKVGSGDRLATFSFGARALVLAGAQLQLQRGGARAFVREFRAAISPAPPNAPRTARRPARTLRTRRASPRAVRSSRAWLPAPLRKRPDAPAAARSCRRVRRVQPRAAASARYRAAPPPRPDATTCGRRRRRPARASSSVAGWVSSAQYGPAISP